MENLNYEISAVDCRVKSEEYPETKSMTETANPPSQTGSLSLLPEVSTPELLLIHWRSIFWTPGVSVAAQTDKEIAIPLQGVARCFQVKFTWI